jgi:hypothetical protein
MSLGDGIMGIQSSGKEGSVKKGFWLLILLACLMTPRLVAAGDAPAVVDVPPPAPAPLDVVTLEDGGVLYGEVIEMSGRVLYIKTAAAADNIIKIAWANVSKLSINHPIPFHLKDGQHVPHDPWVQLRHDQETVVPTVANAVNPNPREEKPC